MYWNNKELTWPRIRHGLYRRFNGIIFVRILKDPGMILHWFFRYKVKKSKSNRLLCSGQYKESPHVSIIIQSFNHASNIEKIIYRLRQCQVEEIIVCEDGSIDNSLQRWKQHLAQPNDFIICSNDLHEIRTYNRAARYAQGEILCFMQDDDDLPKNTKWFDDAIKLFASIPDLTILGAYRGFTKLEMRKIKINENKNQVFFNQENMIFNTKGIKYRTTSSIPFMYVAGVNIGPLFVRKEHFIQISGFDLNYSRPGWPGIHLDFELSCRSWLNGGKVGIYDAFVGSGNGGHGTKIFGHSKLRSEQNKNNMLKLFETYGPHMNKIAAMVDSANQHLIKRDNK